ncbi:MAG: LD-carboxypeptidase [Synechococcaceae cyanobacterium]|nr:LD-carboxypeptidase [Synechococcaceae cyanobacterium]
MRRRDLLRAIPALASLPALGTSALGNAALGNAARSATSAALAPPPPLGNGSRVAAVAPGTWWEDPETEAQHLAERLRGAGWQLERGSSLTAGQRWRWFSAPDAQRLQALDRALRDPSINAVFCVAGGWGSARLLESGWKAPAQARWLVGFSDASALLLAWMAAGLGGAVHGSCSSEGPAWTRLQALLRGQAVDPLVGEGWSKGIATGPLVVTNLTVATHLIGTPWLPNLKGCVLVIEDTGEAPYRIDRLLTHWRSAGLLDGVAGVGVGRMRWKEDDVLPGDLSMEEVLRERLLDLQVPVVAQLPVGHGQPNMALPLGRLAELNGYRGSLSLL